MNWPIASSCWALMILRKFGDLFMIFIFSNLDWDRLHSMYVQHNAYISLKHISDFLQNTKLKYQESVRIQIFVNFCRLAEWCAIPVTEYYNLDAFNFYLRVLTLSKMLLSKRALHELEEGSLYVSTTFVNNILEKLRLPLSQPEIDELLNKLNALVEDNLYVCCSPNSLFA